jgi:HTH-like domain
LIRYRSCRPDDGILRSRLKTLAAERLRFGYRRLHILLRREGLHMNHKKLRRLYREEKLQVRRRGGRKRALGTRAPLVIPQGANQRWSLDFVSDQLGCGRRFRILTMVDDFTKECLALVADTSLWALAKPVHERLLTLSEPLKLQPACRQYIGRIGKGRRVDLPVVVGRGRMAAAELRRMKTARACWLRQMWPCIAPGFGRQPVLPTGHFQTSAAYPRLSGRQGSKISTAVPARPRGEEC